MEQKSTSKYYKKFRSIPFVSAFKQYPSPESTDEPIQFVCCNGIEIPMKGLKCHIVSGTHCKRKEAMPIKEATVQKQLMDLETFQKENGAQGQTLDHNKKAFCMKLVGMFTKSNIAFNAIEEIQDNTEEIVGKGLRICGMQGLTDLVQPMLQEQKGYVKTLITECYKQFSLIVDGLPFFADVVAFKIHLVHKEMWVIYEPLLHLKLYSKTLNCEQLAGEILQVLEDDYPELEQHTAWRASMMDCTGTNQTALRLIGERRTNTKPFEAPCCSHGANNCGKGFKYPIEKELLKNLTGIW
jgi:hypothetical protein